MANQAQRVAREPEAAAWRLTEGLNAKLTELTRAGFEVLWIEACVEDLTRLVMEGGESAIRLDPDPSLDRAWFSGVEIRHTATRQMTWVFVKGEVAAGEVSAHIVGPPTNEGGLGPNFQAP
jgi:hypothetical protein